MEQFIVSARKYRPATFNTVVGQASITTTLKNAIRTNQLAQAFLFTGPRGVGKTTCARILAKTINCTNLTPDTEGCNECESCVSFNNGQSLNIFELDAASNSSVDDMRALVEQVRYHPQGGRYRTYIIDEVHMLSTAAFNAFLKTLEEPPAYAKFILATTEKHKIIPTILSRCQIFDFNRITIEDIAQHLSWVAANEQVNAEPEALHLIAQKADGALRDALSIFDQIVSFAGSNITYKHVTENLNVLDHEYYFKVIDFALSGDLSGSLLMLDEVVSDGFHLHHFVSGLSSHIRDLMVSKDPQTISLLETTATIKSRYQQQAQSLSASLLFSYLDILSKCDQQFGMARNQRLHTELALMRMCSLSKDSEMKLMDGKNISQLAKKNPAENVTAPVPASTIQHNTGTAPIPLTGIVVPPLPEIKSTPAIAMEPAPEPVEKPAVPAVRGIRGATISIHHELNTIGDKKKTEEKISIAPVEITAKLEIQDVEAGIRKLSEQLTSEGRQQLAMAMTMHPAAVLQGNVVEFMVGNALQSEEIMAVRPEIVGWFRKNLAAPCSDIKCKIIADGSASLKAYTPLEKFNSMAAKNPALSQLRERFDLDVEF